MPSPCAACARPAWKSVRHAPRMAADTGFPSMVTSGSSRCRPRSRCMKKGSGPSCTAVVATARLVVVRQAAADRLHAVLCRSHRVDQPVPRRVLVVVQVALRADAVDAGVEGVDEHGRDGGGAGDLDAGLAQLGGNGRHPPRLRGVAGGRALGELPLVYRPVLRLRPRLSEGGHPRPESPVHVREVHAELRRKQLIRPLDGRKRNAANCRHPQTP